MQHAKAMSNATAVGDEDLTALWTTGIILMVMGAIYMMQLMAKGVHCCMRRLWASGSQVRSEALASTSTTVGYETSEEEMSAGSSEISAQHLRRRVFGEEAGDSETQRMRTQSGSHGATSGMDVSATMTLQSMPRSGSAASMTLQSTPVGLCSIFDFAERATLGLSSIYIEPKHFTVGLPRAEHFNIGYDSTIGRSIGS
jgi:hypothetical protein